MKKFLFFIYIFLTVPGIMGITSAFSCSDNNSSISEPVLMCLIGVILIFIAGKKEKQYNI
ncbi:MAG: hypothetical protein JJV89_04765 [Desulfosarcina sp.]|nr:hypothetical protein [Desulfobacterales bacterium]